MTLKPYGPGKLPMLVSFSAWVHSVNRPARWIGKKAALSPLTKRSVISAIGMSMVAESVDMTFTPKRKR